MTIHEKGLGILNLIVTGPKVDYPGLSILGQFGSVAVPNENLYVPDIVIWPFTESKLTVALPDPKVSIRDLPWGDVVQIGQTMSPLRMVAVSLKDDEVGAVKDTFAFVAVRLYVPWLTMDTNLAVTFPLVDISAAFKQ